MYSILGKKQKKTKENKEKENNFPPKRGQKAVPGNDTTQSVTTTFSTSKVANVLQTTE